MGTTLYGLIRDHVYASGVEIWKPTYNPESMLLGLSDYIPAETHEAGISQLRQTHPLPAVHTNLMARVFAGDLNRNGVVAVLPHPMFLSLNNPRNVETTYAAEIREILSDPAADGRIYLPSKSAINKLTESGYYNKAAPAVSSGDAYYHTTPDAFSKWVRKSEAFRTAGLVIGQTDLADKNSNGTRVSVLRYDPVGAVRRVKSALTRSRKKEEKQTAENKKQELRSAVWAAWRTFDGLDDVILGSIVVLKGFDVGVSYHTAHSRHPVRKLKVAVDLADKLGAKGRWRKIPQVAEVMRALTEVRAKLGTEADGYNDQHKAAPVRRAYRWFWKEAEAMKRREKYRRKKPVTSSTP